MSDDEIMDRTAVLRPDQRVAWVICFTDSVAGYLTARGTATSHIWLAVRYGSREDAEANAKERFSLVRWKVVPVCYSMTDARDVYLIGG